MIQFSFAEITI